MFGYSCHTTALSGYQINGDYAGYAQEALEKRYPGVTALFVQGCGGDANPLPRIMNSDGAEAVELVARGEFGRMVCLRSNSVTSASIADAVGELKLVDPSSELVRAARALDISFGD